MDVLTIRVRIAASAPPIVIAGRTRFAREPAPDTGSHPSLIAKIRIRIGPSAKFGNDNPNKLTTESTRSSQRLRRRAERIPAGIDRTIATNSDANVSCSVYGYRCKIRRVTLWL